MPSADELAGGALAQISQGLKTLEGLGVDANAVRAAVSLLDLSPLEGALEQAEVAPPPPDPQPPHPAPQPVAATPAPAPPAPAAAPPAPPAAPVHPAPPAAPPPLPPPPAPAPPG